MNNDNSKILNSFYNKGEFVLILHKAENSSSFSELEIKKEVKKSKCKNRLTKKSDFRNYPK